MIRVDASGFEKVGLRLTAAAISIQNAQPVLKTIGLLMKREVQRNFRESHTPDGVTWDPLKHPRQKRHGGSKLHTSSFGKRGAVGKARMAGSRSAHAGAKGPAAMHAKREARAKSKSPFPHNERPLIDSSALMNGINFETAVRSVTLATSEQTKAYAALQNFGGTSSMPPGPRDVKARQYMGVSDAGMQEITKQVEAFAVKRLRGRSGE